ncbi:DUF3952 domain-containing protein [Flavobacterium sp. UW10123]|uniref:DUF3952 domain-containing protein n=1 Tax=Flavobacterium sp. UW10123 TaxID=3230800 RepID=UPI00339B8BF9
MKKKLNIAILIVFAVQFSSCTKEIDYVAISKKLNEGDLSKIMNANEDKYVHLSGMSFIITENNFGYKKTTKEDISGCLSISDNIGYGRVEKSVNEKIKNSEKDSLVEKINTEFIYRNEQYVCKNNEKLFSVFLFGKLQGLQNVKPAAYTYGLDQPPSLFYRLNQKEFENIINDDLKIKYDHFKYATILIGFHYLTGEEPSRISQIGIGIDYEKKNDQKKYDKIHQYYSIYISRKEDNESAKYDFVLDKKRFNE